MLLRRTARELPAEDALGLADARKPGRTKIVCLALSRIANFDDCDPLKLEGDVDLVMVRAGDAIPGDARLVIIPGSKSTRGDLTFLRTQGWDIDLLAHHRRGGHVLGLCGRIGKAETEQALATSVLDLPEDTPVGETVRGLDLVLVRRGAAVSVFEGRCPHRGALLADGSVIGDDLVCGVHGWDFRVDTGISAYEPAQRIHKFRSMRNDAGGLPLTVGADARITRAGAWLRRTRVDELPQLIDVLSGTMSLVGPRPEVARYVAHYPPGLRERVLSVRPGITDPASLDSLDEATLLARAADPEREYIDHILPRKLRRSADYAAHASLASDLALVRDAARRIRPAARRSRGR